MPIFEYKCKKCKNKFEVLVFGEKKVSCPECGSKLVDKLISNFSFSSGSSNSSISSKSSSSCHSCTSSSCATCH